MAVMAQASGKPTAGGVVAVRLLGRFALEAGGTSAGAWPRPTARRLLQLVLISPRRRITREAACETLFPALAPEAAGNALSKALSLARSVLAELGSPAAELLRADRAHIWAAPQLEIEVDLDAHEEALRAALAMTPGKERDLALSAALLTGGVALEDESLAEWVVPVRERVEYLRQAARLELARDRSRGLGRAHPDDVLRAWQACLDADATCEEAASVLMRLHESQGRRPLALAVYRRCADALAALGLATSPALEALRAGTERAHPLAESEALRREHVAASRSGDAVAPLGEERRLVSVLVIEAMPTGGAARDPEEALEVLAARLAEAIAEAESFEGKVVSISGSGMSVIFGAPRAHEDDPERALRAALRIAAALGRPPGGDRLHRAAEASARRAALAVRIGVETGPAVVGALGAGAERHYGAIGAVVGEAVGLCAAANAGSVLVGPATRAATEGIFEWGPVNHVAFVPGETALAASYLVAPRARRVAEAGRRRLAAKAPLAGSERECSILREAVRETVSGGGRAVVVAGEPGLGKTRLIAECRNYFMAWVGAGSGRLPLWLEGRCVSWDSSTPYGAYKQLLSRFVGVPLEAGQDPLRWALEQALHAVVGQDDEVVAVLAGMIGLSAGAGRARLASLSPAQLHQATFAAMARVLGRLVERGPTVLVLEDLQWADPTSLRLTAELARLCAAGPLLLLVTRRPEPDPGIAEFEGALGADRSWPVRRVELAPLGDSAVRGLAGALLGGGAEEQILDVVSDGVEGNPLFLEERLAALLDSGALIRLGGRWRLARGENAVVSDALERLIRSRVDRLSAPAREAVVAAAVLGEHFERSALEAVSGLDGELDGALAELLGGGLLVETGNVPEPRYRFRHALISEAAYRGLLRHSRRQRHARAAWHLESGASDRLEQVAAVLGGHFAAAGEHERAVHYLELAGDHARRLYANDEATACYRRALAAIDAGPGAAGTAGGWAASATAATLYEKLASLLMMIDRFAEAREAAAAGTARAGGDDELQRARLWVLRGWIEVQDRKCDAALEFLDVAESLLEAGGLGDEAFRLWINLQWLKIEVHLGRGQFELSVAAIERARLLMEQRTGVAVACLPWWLATHHLHEQRFRVDAQMIDEHRRLVDLMSPELQVRIPVNPDTRHG
jgi:DNA-binding SARP family transcriptional activator